MPHRLLASLAVAAACAPLFAQVKETVNVSIANVDVVVTDARGVRVRGLTRDDFEILESGKAREITNFVELTRDAQGAAPPPGRRILLLFDNATLTLGNRRQAVAAARTFLAEHMRPADRVMIAGFGQNLTKRLDWTTDAKAIAEALTVVEHDAQIGSIEYERRRVEQEITDTIVDDNLGRTSPRGSVVTFDSFMSLARNYAANAMRTYSQSLSTLGASLAQLGRAPEKKLVVIVGEGLPLHPGAEIWEVMNSLKSAADSGRGGARIRTTARVAQPLTESGTYDLTPNVRAVAAGAYAHGIAVYALNPGRNENTSGGVENIGAGDNSAEFSRAATPMGGYQLLANLTGGLAFLGARPPLAFDEIANDLDAYYSLGYRAERPAEPGTLVIRSKAGHRVRLTPVVGRVPPEMLMQEAVLIHHTTAPESNELQIRASADPPVADGEKRRVNVKVLIPVRNLVFRPDGPEVVGAFDVYISTGDGKGNASEVNKQTHLLRWPAEALPHLLGRDVTFAVEVILEPGREQISVGVMDPRTEKTGFDRIHL